MSHAAEYSRGCFSVRWDSAIWEAQLDVSDVTAVSPEERRAPTKSQLLRREAS